MAHRTEEPEPISKSRPDVPLELEAIIDKMTAKSPIQRYQTAKEVAEKLRTWLNESGSGRGYSRISALMAEAMRAKQLAGQDTTRMQSAATEDTDLELASLDDEPTRSRSAREGKAGKTTSPDAKNKDRQSVAKNGLAPAAKTGDSMQENVRPPKASPPRAAHPIVAGGETVLPSIGADLLSVPLATEAVPAAALPAAAVAGKSLPQGMTALRPKAAQRSASTVISPWLWGSLAALGLIVLVSSSFILFGRSLTETAGEQLTAKDMPPAPAPATNQVTEGPGPKPGLTTAATSKADEGRPAKPPKASNGPPSKSGQPAIKAMSGAADPFSADSAGPRNRKWQDGGVREDPVVYRGDGRSNRYHTADHANRG